MNVDSDFSANRSGAGAVNRDTVERFVAVAAAR